MNQRLADRVAIVTGGASGIGDATVRLFVQEGARVLIADIQDDRGQALADELGASAIYQRTDVGREQDVADAVASAVREFGRLDCFFANAGIVGALGSIAEVPVEEWDFTMSVNLRGVFFCMKHAARVMRAQRSGVILSTTSVAGLQGGLGPHAYAATKAAVVGLTRNVSAELAPFNVRVNCIAASSLATEMVAGMVFADPTRVSEIEQGMASISPLPGRAGLPQDIARAALYLASDDAGYVTGHTLTVDAGVTTGTTAGMTGLFDGHAPLVREKGQRGLPDEGS